MIIEQSIIINRPIDQVFETATCLRRCVVWRSSLLSSAQTSDGPMKVGATFEQEVHGLGKTYRNVSVVTAYEPPYLFAFEEVEGPFGYKARFTFEPAKEGTRYSVWVEGASPTGWLRIVPDPLIQQWAIHSITQELETLKLMMENDIKMNPALAPA